MGAPSYYALRVCERADGARWWASVRRALPDVPAPVRAIMAGRSRVELTSEEAWAVLAWARTLDGWDSDGYTPLWIYPVSPAER
jgi:hypothetical protein